MRWARSSLACVADLINVQLRAFAQHHGARRSLCQVAPAKEQASRGTDSTRRSAERVLDTVELTFFGTSSGAPTSTRNQQGVGVRLGGETWLFDCGEGTQHRMMETHVTASQIRRIFVSHLHGDHIFGLPGMLCNLATTLPTGSGDTLVQIVGPPGLSALLRTVIGNSYATLRAGSDRLRLQIHELGGMRALRGGRGARHAPAYSAPQPLPCEVEGAVLMPDSDGSWAVPNLETWAPMRVRAVELDHTVPTVGWVLEEVPRAGRLQAKSVLPILQQHGISPRTRNLLKNFKLGVPIQLPDGSVLKPEDYMDKGTSRKLVILSDTRELRLSSSAAVHAAGADLLIHEATNACTDMDRRRGLTECDVHRSAAQHGHSTPQVAGAFARGVGAKNLVLTHFSSRYSSKHYRVMNEIRKLAASAFNGPITTAADLMQIVVNIDGTVRVTEPPPSWRRPDEEQEESNEEHAGL